MSRAVKVFQISVDPDEEPLVFDLRFDRTDGGKEETHTFKAVANPGAGGGLAASKLVRYDDGGKQMIDLNGIMAFFDRVLLPGESDKLKALLERRDLTIPLELLADVYAWLIEEQTGRPTQPSSSSVTGRQETGQPATAPLSSVGSI